MLLAFPRMLRELFYSQLFAPRGGRTNVATLALVGILNLGALTAVTCAAPAVEFDFARTVECRDITPRERLAQYPSQRLIEVELPISVRFNDITLEDVDEIAIEVSGAAAGLRVLEFAPTTQLASEFTHDIETTTTTKKARSLDATLGGSIPIPGAEPAAKLTPSISGDMASCNTAVEKINRLPPKHVVVVSGTYAEGRGVFFKLKRTSQTSLEGVHELAVTFIAPRMWPAVTLQVDCEAVGQRKMLWVKQSATLGHVQRNVQLIAAVAPLKQVVYKPTGEESSKESKEKAKDDGATVLADSSAASPAKWRPTRVVPVSAKTEEKPAVAPVGPPKPEELTKPEKAIAQNPANKE